MPLFLRVFAVNASLLVGATAALVLSPATVSTDAARAVMREGPALALVADLRLLGMRPSVALVEDSV